MVINGPALWVLEPIKGMSIHKEKLHGVSYGLSEAGYDIRIKQDIRFIPPDCYNGNKHNPFQLLGLAASYDPDASELIVNSGRFIIASAIEEFDMPDNLVGIVHDKSTWARKGLSVFNTVIEPGWKGFLTLELVYHGFEELVIKAGSGIAQVLFHQIATPSSYDGKYQNQENKPVAAKDS